MRKPVLFSCVLAVLFCFSCLAAGKTYAQTDMFSSARAAIQIGSSKELAKNFNSVVEIRLEGGQSQRYSETQAEFIMKSFFSKHAPVAFSYNHQGSSGKGQQYAIGTYVAKDVNYTVLIRWKDDHIYAINFIED